MQVGDFVMSVFVPGSQQALTATSDGDLVVWDEQVGWGQFLHRGH